MVMVKEEKEKEEDEVKEEKEGGWMGRKIEE